MAESKFCGVCDTDKRRNQFYKNPLNLNDVLPICKVCTQQKIKEYKKKLGNYAGAFWLVCAEQGIPFLQEVWNDTNAVLANAASNVNLFNIYVVKLAEQDKHYEGFWESDMMLNELVDNLTFNISKDKKLEDFELQQKVWGRFIGEDGRLDQEAYNFLNETFESYTSDKLDMDTNLENRYRDLAKCELRLRRANESNDGTEISKAQDSLNKQLSLLRMNEFQSMNKTEEQLAFEKRVAMIEYSKPAECEDLKKYLDMVGFEKDKSSMMRSLRNAIAETRNYPDIPKEERI